MPEEKRDPDVAFERSDIHAFAVTATGLGVFFGCVAIVFLLWFFFEYMRRSDFHTDARPGLAPVYGRIAEPLLQTTPRADLQQMREEEDRVLNGYNWVDRQRGIVSIPIARAIDTIARQGVPPAAPSSNLQLFTPSAGRRETGFESKTTLSGER